MRIMKDIRILNANVIKIMAAVFMFIDHAGLLLFPGQEWMRCVGRISMPLFAYLIAEGCRYTRDRTKHFAMIFILGFFCQLVYQLFDGSDIYINILFTFSLSILMIYALQNFKHSVADGQVKIFGKILSGLMFAVLVAAVYFLNTVTRVNGKYFTIDYGFWGCMLPVFASLTDFRGINLPEKLKWLDSHFIKLIPFSAGLLLLCLFTDGINEWYAFIALAPLMIYNGKKGRFNLKYFFYVFYPAHLALLEGIFMLINM